VTQPTDPKNSGVILTGGEFFPAGSILEIVRAEFELEEVNLVHWKGKVLEVAADVEQAGREYAPAAIDPSIKNVLRLATKVASPETAENLFMAAHDLLTRHLGQLDRCATAMVRAVFASWMSPALSMSPILWIFSPAGCPRTLVLQLLSLLSRRPLQLVGLRRGDIARSPMSLQPTLLLDEPDPRPEWQTLLRSSSQRGTRTISRHGLVEFFGPKIVFSHKLPRGTALETDALKASLLPITGRLPPLNRETEEATAEEFQARFLGHLLRNASAVRSTNFDASQFTPPIRDLARTLNAAVIGDSEIQKRILPILSVQDEEFRANRARAKDAVVVEACLGFTHQSGWTKIRTDSIAEKACAIYKGRGSDECPSAESVGRALKRLTIPSGRINRAGNGIELTVSTCRLIHQLATAHGVRAMQGAVRGECRYCRELEPIGPAT
jgi:hypothetical protein